ncbi:endonuclease/exonuclease/phosphatase family protein [Kiloniella laminariae]|uniref:Endonuclease/exonuclease/phosphatase family protein n=1 Tax=Kiloniella laminariae TaxID=454162 RepID=A0ABT4LEV6_9PROT|nr:endonuclease/exonuclease/phosphatase family protein [Kiloniella laminariae]MCZ4279643.1 endonuclease/exonuclease/phosphatase family protein [Kiloniella laminariae]
MSDLKITSWNIEHMKRLFETGGSATVQQRRARRRESVAAEITALDADVLCVLEGPASATDMKEFCDNDLAGKWQLIEAADDQYGIRGSQYIWFLVKNHLASDASLLPVATFREFAGESWKVHYWGDFEEQTHRHYRTPQTLLLDWRGERLEFIGLHLKSKFVQRGASDWAAGGQQKQDYIRAAIKARIKLTTEAQNVRNYIDRKFAQLAAPNIFVMGDLNDGPGKEYFERQYLFFDLLSNIQGDVFFARRFLNHALFDAPEELRWSVNFQDFVDPERDPHILLDHILFTQALVDGSKPFEIRSGAGRVEHEIHEEINAPLPQYAHSSDHRPVSVTLSEK